MPTIVIKKLELNPTIPLIPIFNDPKYLLYLPFPPALSLLSK